MRSCLEKKKTNEQIQFDPERTASSAFAAVLVPIVRSSHSFLGHTSLYIPVFVP